MNSNYNYKDNFANGTIQILENKIVEINQHDIKNDLCDAYVKFLASKEPSVSTYYQGKYEGIRYVALKHRLLTEDDIKTVEASARKYINSSLGNDAELQPPSFAKQIADFFSSKLLKKVAV